VIAKKSSFFVDFQRRRIDDNAIINATVLTSSLEPFPFRLGVPVPNENFSLSPRFDYQLGTNHTLILRYSYSRFKAENLGASDFSLPSRAFDRATTEQTFQVTETAILSPKMLNETRFQYIRNRNRQEGGTAPTVVVQESFIQGGSQIGPGPQRAGFLGIAELFDAHLRNPCPAVRRTLASCAPQRFLAD
jgi:hypothetical protein